MSGICGIVTMATAGTEDAVRGAGGDGREAGAGVVRREWLEAMMDAAAYRGPDGRNVHISGAVGLAHLAHTVTPESVGEHQPLVHRPTGVALTADLRLDNRRELLTALGTEVAAGTEVGAGERGAGAPPPSDAALALAAYLRWGPEFATRLLGDFALALWDPRSAALYLARDAMGMRPLYYSGDTHRAVFASEVKQILAAPGVERRLNDTAVATHLSGSHIPLGMTFYEGISQVEPGEVVTLQRGRRMERRRFWRLDPGARIRYRRESEYGEHFRELFLEAVQARLRSVKPVGISLSGGMDSGSVASAVGWLYERGEARHSPPFRAYSWAFEELASCDERAVSRRITDRYGIPVTDIPADGAWPLRHYPEHGPDADEPYIFYYAELIDALLTRAAGDGVGLLMTGERGDALVDHWVYDYIGLLKAARPAALIRELRAHGAAMGLSTTQMAKRSLLRPMLDAARGRRPYPRPARLPAYLRGEYADSEALVLSRAATMPTSEIGDLARSRREQLVFSAMSVRRIELLSRGQARHGIDYADPWSDRRLAEFIIAIPQHLVHRFGDFKRIARLSLGPMLSEELRDNADSNAKANPTPLFERGVLDRSRHVVDELIRDSVAAKLGYVNEATLTDDRRRELAGEPLSYDLWWFLTMEMWLRRFWNT